MSEPLRIVIVGGGIAGILLATRLGDQLGRSGRASAQLSHAMLYRRHQQALHGFGKATLLWTAEQINGLVQPKIRLS